MSLAFGCGKEKKNKGGLSLPKALFELGSFKVYIYIVDEPKVWDFFQLTQNFRL